MRKIIFILSILYCPILFAATLTTNTVPYVCQGGTNPQLCNSNINTDSNGNLLSVIPNNIQLFTSNGTWIKPVGVSKVYVKVWGGGGAGDHGASANAGCSGVSSFGPSGGGAGGYAEGIISVSGNVNIVIGAADSACGGVGGGTSYFYGNTTVSATGGGTSNCSCSQGQSICGISRTTYLYTCANGGSGGSGGVGNNGNINLTGQAGQAQSASGQGGNPVELTFGAGETSNNGNQTDGAVIVYY